MPSFLLSCLLSFFRCIKEVGHTIYTYIAMFFGLSFLGFICSLGLPIALVLVWFPVKWRVAATRQLVALGFTIYLWFLRVFCSVHIDFSELDVLKQQTGLIIVANHPSLLDAVLLLSKLPNATCVMKASLRKNPLLGVMAHLSGYISNEDSMRLVKQSCVELKNGAHLVLFPEGTRSQGLQINPFGQMAALIASRSGASLQTVFIRFSSSYLGKSGSLFQKPQLPLRIKVTLGSKFEPVGTIFELNQRLESHYREYFSDLAVNEFANGYLKK
jgi:1-acyl-sn-glycerol-3-phosphate acyltransferase